MVCMYKLISRQHICSDKCMTSWLTERSLVTVPLTFSREAGDIVRWEARLTHTAEPCTGSSPKIRFPNPAPWSFHSSVLRTHFLLSVLIPISKEIFLSWWLETVILRLCMKRKHSPLRILVVNCHNSSCCFQRCTKWIIPYHQWIILIRPLS